MQDRRKYPRVDVSFPLECNGLTQKKYFYTVSKDLSLGGIKIVCDKFFPKNDLMKISINLIDKIVNLTAKVAWCNKIRASDTYWSGLQFIEANEDEKRELSYFLEQISS